MKIDLLTKSSDIENLLHFRLFGSKLEKPRKMIPVGHRKVTYCGHFKMIPIGRRKLTPWIMRHENGLFL